MTNEVAYTLASILQILILGFMIITGAWTVHDARKRGRTIVEALVWGLFVAAFFLVGFITYMLLRNRLYCE